MRPRISIGLAASLAAGMCPLASGAVCTIVTLFRSKVAPFAVGLLGLFMAASIAQAQDLARSSLAGVAASEANRPSVTQNYNLKVGPVLFKASASLRTEFNDNVNLSSTSNAQSDLIITPQLNLNLFWQATQTNALRLDLGIGYSKYLDNSQLDRFQISPTSQSQLAFDIFVGDFRINLHNQFSLRNDPVQEATLSNVGNFNTFINVAGFTVIWDMNKLIALFGFDHQTYISGNQDFEYLNRTSEIVTGRLSYLVNPTSTVGMQSTAAFTRYQQSTLSNNLSLTIGPFLEWGLSEYTRINVGGGYQGLFFQGGGSNADASSQNTFQGSGVNADVSSQNTYYAQLLVTNRLNAYLNHSLAAGRYTELGTTTNSATISFVRYAAALLLIRNVSLSGGVFFEIGNEPSQVTSTSFNRYGGTVALGYRLTPATSWSAGYQLIRKNSGVSSLDYTQNVCFLSLYYDF